MAGKLGLQTKKADTLRRSAVDLKLELSPAAKRCRRKFLKFFPDGFKDDTYIAWERSYKWQAHERWEQLLNKDAFEQLLELEEYHEIATRAVAIESRTNLLFSFEKMALRDAIRNSEGARLFSLGLFEFLHGEGDAEKRFEQWVSVVAKLPRRQTRVLTWPIVTIFGFIAQPKTHIFVKPMVTTYAAELYDFEVHYMPRPNWHTYEMVLNFAKRIKRDLRDLKPRDMIDIQSFIWVQGTSEEVYQ